LSAIYEAPSFPVIANAGSKIGLKWRHSMLLLKLNKIERTDYRSTRYVDQDDEGDRAQTTPVETTRAVYVVADKIRNFQPRRDNAIGSRITFIDGGGYAVQETVDEIIAFLDGEVHGRTAEVVQITESRAN
jgi:hypothetical protein